MKKQFLRWLSGFIPAIALFTNVNAQLEKPGPPFNPREFMFNEDKVAPAAPDENDNVNIDSRALKNFYKSFKNADKVNWFRIENGFVVKFKDEGVETRVFYNPKGRLSATIRTYGQDKLPPYIRKLVRSTYYDYKIYLVNEITVGDKTAFLVSIEDPENVKTIRITDEDMDVYEDFQKI